MKRKNKVGGADTDEEDRKVSPSFVVGVGQGFLNYFCGQIKFLAIWPVGVPKLGDYTVECEGRNVVRVLV